jgi:hypothetical protein
MKKVPVVVSLVTLFAVFFNIAPYIRVPDTFMFLMFFISPFLVGYMAYVILKYGKPSGTTFDEQFYDDVNQ